MKLMILLVGLLFGEPCNIQLGQLGSKDILDIYPRLISICPKAALSIPSIIPISNFDKSRISRGVGILKHPIDGNFKLHNGIDIAVKSSKIISSASGIVTKVGYEEKGLGNYIIINHGNGYETAYGHLSKIFVEEGFYVYIAEEIAISGSTGKSTGEHLHYEVRRFGIKENPINYMLLFYPYASLFTSTNSPQRR